MGNEYNMALVIGAGLSLLAALMHVEVIMGGALVVSPVWRWRALCPGGQGRATVSGSGHGRDCPGAHRMGGLCTARCRGDRSVAPAAPCIVCDHPGLPAARPAGPLRTGRYRAQYPLHHDQLGDLSGVWAGASVRAGASVELTRLTWLTDSLSCGCPANCTRSSRTSWRIVRQTFQHPPGAGAEIHRQPFS